MNKKISLKVLCLAVCLFNFLINSAYSNPALIIDASDSTGKWSKGVVTGREVVSTNKSLIKSEVQVYIENPGKYQLFSYIHHNYRKAIPCIYTEVSNDKGILYNGYHRIENIWYLDKIYPGRWFMVSLTQDPYLELPRGNLTIRFWADAFKENWDNSRTSMEGKISIDKLFLVPVKELGGNLFLPWLIFPEDGEGDWDISEYHQEYATNLVESSQKGQSLVIPVIMPYSGYFRLWGSVFSTFDNSLKVVIQGKSGKQVREIEIKGQNKWSFISSDPIYLDQGEYKVILNHANSNSILVDYLMFLPEMEHRN